MGFSPRTRSLAERKSFLLDKVLGSVGIGTSRASAPRRGHRAIGTIVDGTLVTTTRRGAACRRLFEGGLWMWSRSWVETRNISTGIGYLVDRLIG
jgi:hypothetical protein